MRVVRWLLVIEALALMGAAILHLPPGSLDPTLSPSIYEGSIAVILFAGLLIGLAARDWAAWAAVIAQAIGLAGASVGLSLALIGVAPDSVADLVFHLGIVVLLAIGLVLAWRARAELRRLA